MKKAVTATLAIIFVLLCANLMAQDKTDEQLRKEHEGVTWDKAHAIESEHYTVKCNATEEVAKRYCALMEKLFNLYNATFPNLYAKKMKWDVWVYRTRHEFQERHSKKASATAGYYAPWDKRIYTYHGLFGVSGSTFNILAHEGTHAFQHSFLKSLYETPQWLLEGMAVVFEGVKVGKDGALSLKKPPRDRLVQVKMELKDKKALKLSEVVGENAKPLTRRTYAYAGLFIWWLAKTQPAQRRVLDQLLKILTTRKYEKNDLENLLRSHLGKDLDEVEKKWRAWIRKERVEYTGRTGSGGSYSSKLSRFSIKRPGSNWKMDGNKAPVNGECIVYLRKRTGGRISVTVYSNQLPLGADELYLQWLRDLEGTVSGLKVEHRERVKIKGRPGFRITYEGTEPRSGITTEKQRVQINAVVTARHIYVIRMQSPPQKWKENSDDFARAIEKFKLAR